MPALRRFRLALLLLLGVALCGAAGYVLIERWNPLDALFVTVVTLTTNGMADYHTLSPAGRVFTLFLILAGVTAVALVAGAFAQVVVGEQLRGILERHRMERQIDQLSGHFIVCGWGRMGQEIVEQFRHKGAPCVVIEVSEEQCARLARLGILHVQGDASDDRILLAAGVERAQGLITVAPRDADNIFITLSARALNKGLFIVTRSIHQQDVHKLEVAGADRVVSPYIIGARRIAAAAFHPTVCDFLDQEIERDEIEWELENVPVMEAAAFRGKSLRESGIREQTGCTVLAIKEGSTRQFRSNPSPDARLEVGDVLIVLGAAGQLERLQVLAGMPTPSPHSRPGRA